MINVLFLVVMISTMVWFQLGASVFAACADNPNNIIPAPGGLPTLGCDAGSPKIDMILKLVFGALALLSLLFIVIGGLRYTLSGGDSNAIASAKKTITYAVIGLVIGVSTFTIIDLLFSWIGS